MKTTLMHSGLVVGVFSGNPISNVKSFSTNFNTNFRKKIAESRSTGESKGNVMSNATNSR